MSDDRKRHLPVVGDDDPGCEGDGAPLPGESPAAATNRRSFLRTLGNAAAALTLASCGSLDDLFRRHFHEMSQDEIQRLLKHHEKKYAKQFHQPVKVANTPPIPGVSYGYGLDLSRCIGCRRCVYACMRENNQSRDPSIQWIRVLEMDKEKGIDVDQANQYYDAATVPQPGKLYMPIQCHHCENAPCVKVCPVKATWQEPDGIVVVDYDRCVGCRCCMAACPYGARHFNWAEPHLPPDQLNPNTHYLGNRPRPRGVVEKCTFCIQRVRNGRYPACVEICPVGARKFGNLLDPNSEIRYVLEHKRTFIFKEELNTHPRFFYFYGV